MIVPVYPAEPPDPRSSTGAGDELFVLTANREV